MARPRGAANTYPNEDVLPDDYPVFCMYCYVADGHVVRSMIQGTVRQLRADIADTWGEPVKEIRRCDLAARDLL